MRLLFNSVARVVGRLFSSTPPPEPKRSLLLGMYLSQTNNTDGQTAKMSPNRERRNGRYSHNRERE